MLICSPVSVSLCLHLLVISDLLFFSTRAPQPSFSVSLSCCTPPCAFCATAFYALCPLCIQCTIPLLCIPAAAHSSFYTPESLLTTATCISSLFNILIVSVHLVHAISPCFCMLSPCRVLCLIIIATLQLLWRSTHASIITGCYAEIPWPVWQLRLFVFFIIVELIPSVAVTGFNALPSVNRLYEQSSFHWQMP
jgi:hypothetical protein